MLDWIEIKNFRSCEDVRLRLGEPVIALLGKNGAGKTSLLHAIQLVAELCAGDAEPVLSVHPRNKSEPTEFRLGFKLGGSQFVYRISRAANGHQGKVAEEAIEKDGRLLFRRMGESVEVGAGSRTSELRIGARSATLQGLLQILPDGDPMIGELKPIAGYLRSVRYYPLLQGFQEHLVREEPPIIESAKYEAWSEALSQGRLQSSVQMRLIHLYRTARDRFDELSILLGPSGLGLISEIRIQEIKLPKALPGEKSADGSELGFYISFKPGPDLAGSGEYFRYSGLSAGTWRILHLMTALIFDGSTCMLLEQPEDSVHPGLLAKVMDILRTYSGSTQLICTTHSPRVMNLVGAAGIRLITAERGRTIASALTTENLSAAKKYLEDEGSLAEFLDTL